MSINVRSGQGQIPTFVFVPAVLASSLVAISASVAQTNHPTNVTVPNVPGLALAKFNAIAQLNQVIEVLNVPGRPLATHIADPNFATRVFATRPALTIAGTGRVHQVTAVNTVSVAKKWRPGHYMLLFAGDSNSQATLISRANEIANEPQVRGMVIQLRWDQLETTQGNYQWTMLDAVVAQMATNGKYLWVQLRDRNYGGVSNANLAEVPPYVKDIGGTLQGVYATNTGGAAALWRSAVMDRYIALCVALANRYEDSPNFHGFFNGESAPGSLLPADYSAAAHTTELLRLFAACASAARKSWFVPQLNFLSNPTLLQLVQNIAASGQLGIGGPDLFLAANYTAAEQTFIGTLGGHNYRGEIAAAFQAQSAGVAQSTFAQMQASSVNIQNAWMIWTRETTTTPGAAGVNCNWPNIVLPAIRTGTHPTAATLPPMYTAPLREPYMTAPSSLTVSEGTNATITVTSTATWPTNTSIAFTLTPLGGAVAGTDYTATASPLVLLAGQSTATLTIPILSDAVTDPNESVRVNWGAVTPP